MAAINSIPSNSLEGALIWTSIIMALMYVVAVAMKLYIGHIDEPVLSERMRGAWFWLMAIYWGAIAIARIALGYTGPSAPVSLMGTFTIMLPAAMAIYTLVPHFLNKINENYRCRPLWRKLRGCKKVKSPDA